MANILFLGICLIAILGINIFYSDWLYIESIIIYDILNA